MKLIKILIILLGIQILIFGLAIQILYASSHDGVDSFAGLGALLPLGIFGIFTIVDTILFIIYLVMVIKKKLPLNIFILIFVVLNILLIIFDNTLTGWALSGPG